MVQGRRKTPLQYVCSECLGEAETLGSRVPVYCSATCRERARYRRDRGKRLTAVRNYRESNKDDINARARSRRAANPEKYRKQASESYIRNRSARIADAAKWQRENPDRVAVRRSKRRTGEEFQVRHVFQRRSMNRFRGRCAYCEIGLDLENRQAPNGLHWDHVVPLSRGGRNTEGNLVPSCSRCNLRKSSKFLVQFKRENGKLEGLPGERETH